MIFSAGFYQKCYNDCNMNIISNIPLRYQRAVTMACFFVFGLILSALLKSQGAYVTPILFWLIWIAYVLAWVVVDFQLRINASGAAGETARLDHTKPQIKTQNDDR
jgi:hypothetical protein